MMNLNMILKLDIFYFQLLVLFSFVNIVPFVLTLLFVFISSHKVKIQYILVPALLLIPYLQFFVNKINRILSDSY